MMMMIMYAKVSLIRTWRIVIDLIISIKLKIRSTSWWIVHLHWSVWVIKSNLLFHNRWFWCAICCRCYFYFHLIVSKHSWLLRHCLHWLHRVGWLLRHSYRQLWRCCEIILRGWITSKQISFTIWCLIHISRLRCGNKLWLRSWSLNRRLILLSTSK